MTLDHWNGVDTEVGSDALKGLHQVDEIHFPVLPEGVSSYVQEGSIRIGQVTESVYTRPC